MRFQLRFSFLVVSTADAHASRRTRNRDELRPWSTATNKYPSKYRLSSFQMPQLAETFSVKLGDSALYLLFGSNNKTERIQLLAQCYFLTQQVLQFAFTLNPQLFPNREIEGYRLSSFQCRSVCCAKC